MLNNFLIHIIYSLSLSQFHSKIYKNSRTLIFSIDKMIWVCFGVPRYFHFIITDTSWRVRILLFKRQTLIFYKVFIELFPLTVVSRWREVFHFFVISVQLHVHTGGIWGDIARISDTFPSNHTDLFILNAPLFKVTFFAILLLLLACIDHFF